MRSGVVITGSLLLVLAFVLVGVGAGLKNGATECARARCDDAETTATLSGIGTGILFPGALLGLASVGLLVAGVLAEPRAKQPKRIPVDAGPTSIQRPCPSCEKPLPASARYCAACGCAIAPLMSVQR